MLFLFLYLVTQSWEYAQVICYVQSPFMFALKIRGGILAAVYGVIFEQDLILMHPLLSHAPSVSSFSSVTRLVSRESSLLSRRSSVSRMFYLMKLRFSVNGSQVSRTLFSRIFPSVSWFLNHSVELVYFSYFADPWPRMMSERGRGELWNCPITLTHPAGPTTFILMTTQVPFWCRLIVTAQFTKK